MDKGVPKCIFPRYTDSVVLRATHDLAGGEGRVGACTYARKPL